MGSILRNCFQTIYVVSFLGKEQSQAFRSDRHMQAMTKRTLRGQTALVIVGCLICSLSFFPAAAQDPLPTDPATKALIEMMDLCLSAMKGDVVFDKGASRKAYTRTSNGGWGRKVGKQRLALNLAQTNLANGSFRVCVASLSPASADLAGLKAAVAERAAAFPLKATGPKPDKNGGVISGFENPDGPLIGLTVTETPAVGEQATSTGISVIWRQ